MLDYKARWKSMTATPTLTLNKVLTIEKQHHTAGHTLAAMAHTENRRTANILYPYISSTIQPIQSAPPSYTFVQKPIIPAAAKQKCKSGIISQSLSKTNEKLPCRLIRSNPSFPPSTW